MSSNGLKLYLFGSPGIELDGRSVEIHLHRALALLIFLAVDRQSHRRDALAGFFWPDDSQRQAHGNLRNALWILKGALGEARLAIHREEICLNHDGSLWVDVDTFQQHLKAVEAHHALHPSVELCPVCLAALNQAIQLYRDDFLAGFTVSGSPAFDRWQCFQAEGLRLAYAGALERLAAWHARQCDYPATIDYARRLVLLDPLHERARRLLMEAYFHLGQPGPALRQYQEYAEILKQELSGAPSAEMIGLYESIKAGQID